MERFNKKMGRMLQNRHTRNGIGARGSRSPNRPYDSFSRPIDFGHRSRSPNPNYGYSSRRTRISSSPNRDGPPYFYSECAFDEQVDRALDEPMGFRERFNTSPERNNDRRSYSPPNNNEPGNGKKERLSGSAKKRLLFWMSQGMTYQEARGLCVKPYCEIPEYQAIKEMIQKAKRGSFRKSRSYEMQYSANPKPREVLEPSTPDYPYIPREERIVPRQDVQMERRSNPEPLDLPRRDDSPEPLDLPRRNDSPAGPNFEHDESLYVFIANASRPMTIQETEKVCDKILKTIELSDKGAGPSFLGCEPENGMLLLTCANRKSKMWLTKNINKINPFEGADLRVMDKNGMSQQRIGMIWVSDLNLTQDSLLRRLDSQNSGIDFSTWKILNWNTVESGHAVTFGFDEFDLEDLEERDYKLFLNFGTVTVDLKPQVQGDEEERNHASDKINQFTMSRSKDNFMQPTSSTREPTHGNVNSIRPLMESTFSIDPSLKSRLQSSSQRISATSRGRGRGVVKRINQLGSRIQYKKH